MRALALPLPPCSVDRRREQSCPGACGECAARIQPRFILYHLSLTGFVLGGAFGVFTAGIDTNVGFDPKDPYRTPTAKEVLKDMGQRGISYAKNFAIVGAMFSCTECVVESVSNNFLSLKKCFLVHLIISFTRSK